MKAQLSASAPFRAEDFARVGTAPEAAERPSEVNPALAKLLEAMGSLDVRPPLSPVVLAGVTRLLDAVVLVGTAAVALAELPQRMLGQQQDVLAALGQRWQLQAQHVQTDYDHKAPFSDYRTFTIRKIQTVNPLDASVLRDEIRSDLQYHGWREVPEGGDVAITVIGEPDIS